MRALRRIVGMVDRVLDEIMLVLFLVMTCAIIWQVFARYALGAATAWAEEIALFLLAWVTMLGSALVIRGEGHIAVTLFVEMLPSGLQRVVAFIRDALTIATMAGLALYGYRLCLVGARQMAPGSEIPLSIPYMSIPVGAVLIALFLAVSREAPAAAEPALAEKE